MALRREMSLPASVRGPVEKREFARLMAARSAGALLVVLILIREWRMSQAGRVAILWMWLKGKAGIREK